ncbi:MAG: PKD domain-containing protein [Bacteroidota bacterium]
MKTTNIIKAFISLTILLSSVQVFSQTSTNAYQAETDGYYVQPRSTTKGIVFSDNAASKIYLQQNGETTVLASSRGCGQYYTVSSDQSKIGFKKINKDGTQQPAIIDLQSMTTTELALPVKLCGQVSFSSNGKTAYTKGNDLIVTDGINTNTYNLGTYANIAPVSPDGNFVAFNNDNDQLFVIDLITSQITQITDNIGGYMLPQWSPDGNKLAYSSLSGTLKVWDKTTSTTYTLPAGAHASWSDDSQFIYYDVTSSENFEFKGSEIFVSKYDGSSTKQLTNTPNVHEMYPAPGKASGIIFSTYDQRQIISASVNSDISSLQKNTVVAKSDAALFTAASFADNATQLAAIDSTVVNGDVPYVHQVYDTPNWHSGYWSCAPTTAAMVLGYYNRMPHWDISCSSPSTHTSHYGAYVADYYRYNEIYYNTSADDYASNPAYGGYGYMWGLGSPSSYMDEYFINHDIASVHSSTTTFANVQTEINSSYPFSICSTITASGHLTLAIGYANAQHSLLFNDPYGNKNNGYMNWYGKNVWYDWPGYNNGISNLNSVAWTASSETSELAYSDTLIDDKFYNHGFYMHNQAPSHMRYYRDMSTGGYNDHFWYTYTSASTTVDTCYVSWTPNLQTTGNYEVSVYIPTSNASATSARYKVYYNGGNQTVLVNQAPIYGEWVSLGTFPFLAGSSGYVRVGDGAGTAGQKIAFDACKFTWIAPVPVASYNAVPTTLCANDSVQFMNTSSDATTYNWIFTGGTPANSTLSNPYVTYATAGTYNVSLIATGPGGSDTTTLMNYITVNPLANAAFSASATTVHLPSANVVFTNASTNATSFLWNFGDGTTSTDQDPWHTYTTTGLFTVTLIAYNAQCGNDTLVMTDYIFVDSQIGIAENNNELQISVSPNPATDVCFIEFKNVKNTQLTVKFVDALGQVVYQENLSVKADQEVSKMDISVLSKGIYFVQFFTDRSTIQTIRFVKK